MALITVDQILKMSLGQATQAQKHNIGSFTSAVNRFGAYFGLDKIYNLSSLIGQVMVESGEFKHDREIWGPTSQQKKYEGRKDWEAYTKKTSKFFPVPPKG